MKGEEEKIEYDKDGIGNEKEKTGTRNNIMLIAIILAMALMAIFIINYQPNSVPNGNKSTNGDTNLTNRTNMTNEEKNLRTWFVLSYAPIRDNLKCISKAAKSENFSQTETCARILKEDSNRSLSQIDSYNTSNISATLRSALSLYKMSLESYHIGGENLETGAKNQNASVMSMATRYIQNGTNYVNSAMTILKVNNTSNASNISDDGLSSKRVKFDQD